MTCHEAQELIEAVASGDIAAPPAFAAHVAGCHECTVALEFARGIERALRMRPEQAAPADFTRTVTGAIRRRRWEYDQHVDRAFNVAIALGVTLIVVAVVSLLNAAALAQMLMAAADAVAELPNQSPSWGQIHTVPMATIAITVVGTGIAVWWWAEHRPDYRQR